MRRSAPSLPGLQARLERLKKTCACLRVGVKLGRQVRAELLAAGSPVWEAAEECRWQAWIEHEGDEYARLLLSQIYVALAERAAALKTDAPADDLPRCAKSSRTGAHRDEEVSDGAF